MQDKSQNKSLFGSLIEGAKISITAPETGDEVSAEEVLNFLHTAQEQCDAASRLLASSIRSRAVFAQRDPQDAGSMMFRSRAGSSEGLPSGRPPFRKNEVLRKVISRYAFYLLSGIDMDAPHSMTVGSTSAVDARNVITRSLSFHQETKGDTTVVIVLASKSELDATFRDLFPELAAGFDAQEFLEAVQVLESTKAHNALNDSDFTPSVMKISS